MDVLRHITENQDFSFTKNIKVSSFMEGSRTHEALPQAPQQEKKVEPRVRGGFKTMVLCILSEYDPMYQGLNHLEDLSMPLKIINNIALPVTGETTHSICQT